MFTAHHMVIEASWARSINFSGNDDAFAPNVEGLECCTHLNLSFTKSVNFSGIKEINTEVEAFFDCLSGEIKRCFIVGVEPVSVSKYRDFEARASELSVVHLGVIRFKLLLVDHYAKYLL